MTGKVVRVLREEGRRMTAKLSVESEGSVEGEFVLALCFSRIVW